MGSNQRLPQIMQAWEKMHDFIILKEYVGLRVKPGISLQVKWTCKIAVLL